MNMKLTQSYDNQVMNKQTWVKAHAEFITNIM
jgi:hypothetical protein